MNNKLFRAAFALAFACFLSMSCASDKTETPADKNFSTSGSREADQRAEQRVSKDQQLRGESKEGEKSDNRPTLYDRLGAEKGIQLIVADFVERVIADPRANWIRKGLKHGGFLGVGSKKFDWKATEENVQILEQHLVQFIAVATGGPTLYEGRSMDAVHSGMKITNAEFDASIGALKASLDRLHVAPDEQKELLAVFESTRPQIVEKR